MVSNGCHLAVKLWPDLEWFAIMTQPIKFTGSVLGRTLNNSAVSISKGYWRNWCLTFQTKPEFNLYIIQGHFVFEITRQIWGIWKLRPAYSPVMPNLGQNRWCFVPCDLEIWWMTLEHKRASLLYCFKLCATFHSHSWIQTGVTVRKRPIWVKFDDF